ncbi:TIR domain-containing protein [Alteromonas sp. ASW11-36]|uniref:TIR domain-containing protein n=1 Tax=Alteromonas arenosi TaxID=3055817 RepID=A0ABT7SY67_9ALTE|nr:TIR domain-containing protein [Alteromonas sp. ASW11-36]MDM7861127.1 TIR domain-containing protein [Alteromonas sp. ASW11-36]
MSKIFISHSSANNFEALAVQEWLLGQGWDELFLDLDPKRGIAAGERWERSLHEAANRCDAVLFCVTEKWLESEWCRKEYRLARRLNKQLFGLLMEELDIGNLPEELTSTWQLVELATGTDHEIHRVVHPYTNEERHVHFSKQGLTRLHTGLVKAGLDPKFFEWPPSSDPFRPPYRGLLPMESCDAGIFFGREAPTIELLARLRGLKELPPPRFMVILGASGAGKSSFLRAGIMPRLSRDERHFVPLPIMRPENAAITGDSGLANTLLECFSASQISTNRAALRELVLNAGESATHFTQLMTLLCDYYSEKTKAVALFDSAQKPALILSIDQAEELFMGEGEVEADKLLELLKRLAVQDELPIIVLFTIRSDSYETLQAYKTFSDVSQQTFSLAPMPKGAYQEVIEGPAKRMNESGNPLDIEPALTEALLKDLDEGSGKDALPLLAFTLERLHKDYGADGDLTLAEYHDLGGINGAITAATEEVFQRALKDSRLPSDRSALEALMRRAIVPWLAGIDPETQAPRRRIARMSEIPSEAHPLVELLVEQRLLSTDINTEKEITVEPAHEALLRQWGLLKGWLEDDFAALMVLESLQRATRDWLANNSADDWLNHTAGRLEDAEALRARTDMANFFSSSDDAYLHECRKREDAIKNKALNEAKQLAEAKEKEAMAQKRAAELTRKGLIVASLLLVIAIFAGWQAFEQKDEAEFAREEAQQALAVSLAAQADTFADRDEKDKALLYYKESLKRNFTPQVETKTWQLLNQMPLAVAQATTGLEPTWAMLSLAERGVALVGSDLGGLYVITTTDKGLAFEHHKTSQYAISALAASADGQWVYAGDTRGDIWQLDFDEDNKLRATRILSDSDNDQIRALAVHEDGQLLALGLYTGEVMLYSNADNSKSTIYADPAENDIYALQFVSDTSEQLFIGHSGNTLVELSGDNYTEVSIHDVGVNAGRQFFPSGNNLYFLSQNALTVWNTETSEIEQSIIIDEPMHNTAMLEYDGSIFIGGYNGELLKVDKDSLKILRQTQLKPSWLQALVTIDDGLLVFNDKGRAFEIDPSSLNTRLATPGRTVEDVVVAASEAAVFVGSNEMLYRYDSESLTPKAAVTAHLDNINAVAISPSGDFVATTSEDETVKIWRTNDLTLAHEFSAFEGATTSAFYATENTLLIGDERGHLSAIDISEQTVNYQASLHHSRVNSISMVINPQHTYALNASGTVVISVSGNGRIVFSDLATGTAVRAMQLSDSKYSINDSAFDPQGGAMAIALDSGKVCVWEHSYTEEYLYQSVTFGDDDLNCLQLHTDSIESVVHASDRWLAGAANGELIEFNSESLLRTFPVHKDAITQLDWNAPSQTLITAADDTRLKMWRLPAQNHTPLPESIEALNGNLYDTLLLDNEMLIAGGFQLNRVYTMPLGGWYSGELYGFYESSAVGGNQFYALAANEQYIAFGGQNGYLALQDRDSGNNTLLPITQSYIQHLAFSVNTSKLFAAYNDGRVEIFDTDNPLNTPVHFYQHESAVTGLIVLPNSQNVLTSDVDGYIYIWNELSGEVVQQYKRQLGVGGIAISSDGSLIAVGESDGTVSLYAGSIDEQKLVWRMQSIDAIYGLLFSQADDTLVVYSRNQVSFINVNNGTRYFESEVNTSKYYNKGKIHGTQLVMTGNKGLYERYNLVSIKPIEGVELIPAITETIDMELSPNQRIRELSHRIELVPAGGSND